MLKRDASLKFRALFYLRSNARRRTPRALRGSGTRNSHDHLSHWLKANLLTMVEDQGPTYLPTKMEEIPTMAPEQLVKISTT